MIMSDLPHDLVEEIRCMVPTTCWQRSRSTCKRWNALFKDQRFIEKHIRKSASPSLVLMLKEQRIWSMNVSRKVADLSLEFKVPLFQKDSHSDPVQVHIFHVSHCGGLLLCHMYDTLLVWNPCLGETRWIQTKTYCDVHAVLGYENNKSCPRFKILRCYEQNSNFVGSEIYECSSDSWRALGVVALNCHISMNTTTCVTLKGDAYWPADDRRDNSKFLLSFDFTRESFRRLCLPTFQNPGYEGNMALSVVREEQLSVVHLSSDNTPKMEIWVTSKIDTEAALSWSKSFTADLFKSRGEESGYVLLYTFGQEVGMHYS